MAPWNTGGPAWSVGAGFWAGFFAGFGMAFLLGSWSGTDVQ
jgi:hypothetical protein